MKKVVKGIEPPLLQQYRRGRANATWSLCKSNNKRRDQIQLQLRTDLGGLCAYCEVDLLRITSTEQEADFQVEHFHPKSDNSTGHNWHLDWQNMLACCLGGKNKQVVDAEFRHTNPDLRCGALKDNNNWDGVILNPLHIPHSPRLFDVNRSDGLITVNEGNCNSAGISSTQAQATVDNLNLNCDYLSRSRNKQLDNANEKLIAMVNAGMTPEAAKQKLARALFKKDANGCWPKFFTALRAYLGNAAEAQLAEIGYAG